MKNIEQLLYLATIENIITKDKKNDLYNLFLEEYNEYDLYKNKLFSRRKILNLEHNLIDEVLTFAEATELYNLSKATLRKSYEYGRFKEQEIKKSGGTWLVTISAVERLYPSSKDNNNDLFIEFLSLAEDKGILTSEEKDSIVSKHKKEYSNTDLYKVNEINSLILHDTHSNPLEEVMTFKEVSETYNIPVVTLRKNVEYGKYLDGEVRQSKGTWLITKTACERLYCERNK